MCQVLFREGGCSAEPTLTKRNFVYNSIATQNQRTYPLAGAIACVPPQLPFTAPCTLLRTTVLCCVFSQPVLPPVPAPSCHVSLEQTRGLT